MDEPAQADGVVERSRSHFLTYDADGWALWSVDQDDDEPLLTFAPDEGGGERALAAFHNRSRETERVRWLAILAVVAGVLFLVLEVADPLIAWLGPIVMEPAPADLFGDPIELDPTIELRQVLSSFSQVAFTLFQVSVGLFVVVWLQRRWRREG